MCLVDWNIDVQTNVKHFCHPRGHWYKMHVNVTRIA